MSTSPELCFYVLFCANLVLGNRNCDSTDARNGEQCSESEYCSKDNKCECQPGYVRVNDSLCASKNMSSPNYSSLVSNDGGGSLVAGILIPLCLILLVISIVYAGRKYNFVGWVRHRLNQRSNNYDEFMIGHDIDDDDDDPPIH